MLQLPGDYTSRHLERAFEAFQPNNRGESSLVDAWATDLIFFVAHQEPQTFGELVVVLAARDQLGITEGDGR
jgi:hypothetical protein